MRKKNEIKITLKLNDFYGTHYAKVIGIDYNQMDGRRKVLEKGSKKNRNKYKSYTFDSIKFYYPIRNKRYFCYLMAHF